MQTLKWNPFPKLVCPKHCIWDVHPCPWPDCSNGLSDDQFQVEWPSANKAPTAYVRRTWVSPLGGNYYTWDGDNLPNYFSVSKTLWNEFRRNDLVISESPDFVYHYTSLEGFVGIVRSRALWLSDYSYLNDKRELAHGADLVRKLAAEMIAMTVDPVESELLDAWINDLGSFQNRVCIASFSDDGDSLSQWRAYGQVALGFKPDILIQHVNQSQFRPVEYDKAKQIKISQVCLNHLCQAYLVDTNAGRLARIERAYHDTRHLLELISFFKDESFHSEREFRLAYIENPQLLKMTDWKELPKHFRISKSRLLPYVQSNEVTLSEHSKYPLEIGEIVLGPDSDELLERGVLEFLASENLESVPVRRSAVPYRT